MRRALRNAILLHERLRGHLTTLVGRALAWVHGVDLGGGVKFHGLPHFRISSGGFCSFGSGSQFRSSATSNLIGINRPCIVSVHDGARLQIGPGCGFSGTVIGAFESIIIGRNVRCGANTLITDGDWHRADPRSGPPEPIDIGDDVWLGVNVTVLKGVRIGRGSVIGAGSVVTSDIPANVVAAGVPCKVIRSLPNG